MTRQKTEKIVAEMSVLDIVSEYPTTEAVFKSYDERVGECICCQSLFETVHQVAEKYKLDLAVLLDEMNAAIKE